LKECDAVSIGALGGHSTQLYPDLGGMSTQKVPSGLPHFPG
jgi:hypothetical protein